MNLTRLTTSTEYNPRTNSKHRDQQYMDLRLDFTPIGVRGLTPDMPRYRLFSQSGKCVLEVVKTPGETNKAYKSRVLKSIFNKTYTPARNLAAPREYRKGISTPFVDHT